MEASSEVRDTGMGAVLRRQRIETSSHQRERYYAFPVAKSALRTSFTFVILSGGAQSEAQSKDHYELDPSAGSPRRLEEMQKSLGLPHHPDSRGPSTPRGHSRANDLAPLRMTVT